jgi:hypothetical protein
MTEFRPTLCVDACKQGLLTCLLKRLKVGKRRKNEIIFFLVFIRPKLHLVLFVCIAPN